ncbi:MAG: ferrous iron transport protein A [Methanomicrobiales archaeon HGW-Methanomicrobiales-2]|jgi:ferrous iron transport protein A|nr:MAG: ferrous iron transport protein A [Methanomicrobiales archaeon HGW-Methanomicrobiales-2]
MEPSDRNAPSRGATTTLDRIGLACRCHVVGIRASGALRKRLLAMGMVPGADVEAVRAAPLGDPVEYRVKGYALSLRRAEAGLIEVVLEEE